MPDNLSLIPQVISPSSAVLLCPWRYCFLTPNHAHGCFSRHVHSAWGSCDPHTCAVLLSACFSCWPPTPSVRCLWSHVVPTFVTAAEYPTVTTSHSCFPRALTDLGCVWGVTGDCDHVLALGPPLQSYCYCYTLGLGLLIYRVCSFL